MHLLDKKHSVAIKGIGIGKATILCHVQNETNPDSHFRYVDYLHQINGDINSFEISLCSDR